MQDYNTIIGSIQMRLNGCQTRSVMDRYKIGSGTLNLIMSRYHANGIPIEELRMMAPKEVENLFYPQKNLQRKDVPLPDFQYYYDRIHAPGSRMNISFCWLDYKEKNPDGYEKSQFYEYFNRFIAENYGGQKVSMAVNRIPAIIGSIQMRLNGCQTRSVMDRYKIGSGTLNLIMSRYHANGIPIEELRMMAPKEVENLFYPQKNLQRKDVPLPDFQYYYDRIHAPGSRMNISFCWLDYKEKNPDGYEKSQFYEYFNRFIAENYGGQKVSMAVNRIPGEKMYIDWVGDQPELLTDTETGEMKKVHIFATTLGVSSLIYAEAFPNEKLPCFIEGCAHAVSFYGAVTKYFVPDIR